MSDNPDGLRTAFNEVIGNPPEPAAGMESVDVPVELVPFTEPKARDGDEPTAVDGFVQGAIKRVPELRWDAELERNVPTGRMLNIDDAGTEHPVA